MPHFVFHQQRMSPMSIAWLALLFLFGHDIVLADEPKFRLACGQKHGHRATPASWCLR